MSKRKIESVDPFDSRQDVIKLVPRPVVPFSPAKYEERRHYLRIFHEQLKKLGTPNAIVTAVDQEHDVASKSKTQPEYIRMVKRRMYEIVKKKPKLDSAPKGLSCEEYVRRLQQLCVSRQMLLRHGFILDVPEAKKHGETLECAHCKVTFLAAEEYLPTHKSVCRFHPGKIITSLSPGIKKWNYNYANRRYSCCNETPGHTEGCRELDKHVYKLNDPAEMHFQRPFATIEELREKYNIKDKAEHSAIGLDCEMCYTSCGFEMMKLSLVKFPECTLIMDEIVKPKGDVIDLNTFVSGVDSIPEDAMTWEQMLEKMARLTDENTVIIGHGLENDLNVLRIVYSKIVDTAVLFSEKTVDPRRKDPLKKLAWRFLSKNIQGGQHDSLEDAIIPLEIVKKQIEKMPSTSV
ncbi:hypothetical protein KL930_000963 [Ogataea haglerorum]|uniref:RNA exonuclease 3 n=1 Tax=Ogataea haglerorum TaxID=1937702 RepID=A0AAN6I3E9_9ASCO|nr:uncharacterized protein KL911_001171 [Ogataea haglerorum]KAG7700275.1 hypothetical protein KL915_000964 [Ogataea haglerorum]KAG7701934.1 hypothetical protein KL951_000390 [Ogataea haglerorum]KAG7711746.1 hypothetical protein KL914_000388 [Ogataea haglerorum]KAG7712519.1 hypothetical protein KL950_000390 [Ogataea haglerorum]KAG7722570.1 hypothetical protein KL913_000390 [Ogataea haglerorum]